MIKEYNYDIINIKDIDSTSISTSSQYLLGNSIKEAEDVLAEFNTYINVLASTYASSTNIDKSDFFGDAILALGKAKRDFDIKRSENFSTFAKFLIIDSMNECVRKNKALVVIPTYINKAHKIITRIKTAITKYYSNMDDIITIGAIDKCNLPNSIKSKILNDITLLERAAKRASLTIHTLINKAEYLPLVVHVPAALDELGDFDVAESSIIAKLIVEEIKLLLNKEELSVANLIMKGNNKAEISRQLNKSNSWILNRIKAIRSKVKQKVLSKNNK